MDARVKPRMIVGGECRTCNRRWASSPWSPSPGRSARTAARCRGSARRSGSPSPSCWRCSSSRCRRSRAAFAHANGAVDAIAAATRAGTSFVFGYLGGGPLPFELKFPGRRIRAGVPGAADRAGDERADHAAVLLGHPAADRARLLVGAGAHARRRRRGRALDRRQHFRRHGRGAAVHPALPRPALAQRTVRGDDRRHGRHRRHRAGALRASSSRRSSRTPPAISSSPRCSARRSRS